jgi:hypothetical protein
MCELSELSELSLGSELGLRSAFGRPENMRDKRGKRDKGVSKHACYPYQGAAELCSRRISLRLVT